LFERILRDRTGVIGFGDARTARRKNKGTGIMQRITLVRYTVKSEYEQENETLARAVFKELRQVAPKDVVYAVFRNGQEYVHLFVNTANEDSSAVTDLASFKTYVKDIGARCVSPPEQTRLGVQLLESYGLPAQKQSA
jgi:hypothetical protein